MSAEPTANLKIKIDDSNATDALDRLVKDLKEFKKELGNADKQTVTFASALDDAAKSAKEIDKTTKKSTAGIADLGKEAWGASADISTLSKESSGASTGIRKLGTAALKADADTKKLGAGQRGVAADINRTGISAKGTGADASKMGNDARAAATKIDNLGRSSKQASNSIATLGQTSKNTSSNIRNIGNTSQASGRDVAAMSVSVLGLGQSITGVSDTAFGFQEKVVALQRSSFGLEQTTIDLRRAEEDLEAAIKEGTISKQELARQEEDLATLRRDHAIEIEEVRTEQEALNAEYVTFAVNIATTAVQGHIAVTQALGAEKSAMLASRAATILKSRAVQAAVFDVSKFKSVLYASTGANVAFGTSAKVGALGVRTATAAVKGFLVAIGPVGWAIIGVAAAWEAWNSNLFGFRDAIKSALIELQKMYDTVKWLIPVIGLVDEAFKAFDPEGHARAADSVTTAIQGIGKETEEITIPAINGLNESFTEGQEVLGNYTNATASAASTLGNTSNLMLDISGNIATINQKFANDDPFANVLGSADALIGNLYFLQKQLENNEISQENFNLKMLEFGFIFDTIDGKFTTARGPNAFREYIRGMTKEIGLAGNELTSFNALVDNLLKKNQNSNTVNNAGFTDDSIGPSIDEQLGNTVSSSDTFNSIKKEAAAILANDLAGVRNKAGKIKSIAEQEITFMFESVKRKVADSLRYTNALLNNNDRAVKTAIATFTAKSNNNYANPNFKDGGGFTPGVRTNKKTQINRDRYNAKLDFEAALREYEKFFGKTQKFGGLPRRGKTGVYRARASALRRQIENAKQQLGEFPVFGVDSSFLKSYSLRYYQPKRTDRNYRRRHYEYLQRVAGHKRFLTRTFRSKYSEIGINFDADFDENTFNRDLQNVPKYEIIKNALERSKEIEKYYNRILTEDEDLIDIVTESGLTRQELFGYAQSDQHLIDLTGKIAFHDRILLEANSI